MAFIVSLAGFGKATHAHSRNPNSPKVKLPFASLLLLSLLQRQPLLGTVCLLETFDVDEHTGFTKTTHKTVAYDGIWLITASCASAP